MTYSHTVRTYVRIPALGNYSIIAIIETFDMDNYHVVGKFTSKLSANIVAI